MKTSYSESLLPQDRQEFVFRGETFFTRNLGATDIVNGRWVWYAVGKWTHDKAPGVFSDLISAVADRFALWESLGLDYANKFRTIAQREAISQLESELGSVA